MSEAASPVKSRELNMGRDSGWLIGADIFAVFLALVGQVVLTRALITEDYGIFIIALDVFATAFLVIDLGLPTILARDGAKSVNQIWNAIWRIYRIQLYCMIPFLILSIIGIPIFIGDWKGHLMLLFVCIVIALLHIFSYAPRSGLRAAGLAWMEAWTKVIERFVTMSGYLILYYSGNESVESYAIAFLIGALFGLAASLLFAKSSLKTNNQQSEWSELGDCWKDNKSLLIQSLPFAITLGVLPYVVRIEKFIVAGNLGIESAALFHVAQIAWLAGLVVPQAMRAALLPIMGERRNDSLRFEASVDQSLDICFGLLPIGLFGGAILIKSLLPMAFPEQYIDGTLGASAVELFMVLLLGWCFTLLATPTYTALRAGKNPWHFTIFIGAVVVFAALVGFLLISYFSYSTEKGLFAAAIASTISSGFLLFSSIHLSKQWRIVIERKVEFLSTIGLATISCYGFVTESIIAFSGIVIFMFTPRGWRAIFSTD